MSDPAQLELVRKAILSGLSNCVEWVNERAAQRVWNDPANREFTPLGIKQLLIDYVKSGGAIQQRLEVRAEWQDRREYWYCAVIPNDEFEHGLFIEMALVDADPDVPVVVLLNAHPQRK